DIGVPSAPTFTGSGQEANKRAGQCLNIENANTSRKSSSQVDAQNGITGNKIPDQFVRDKRNSDVKQRQGQQQLSCKQRRRTTAT
ncbi:hypothetical protein GIB67_003643, partial [Kingdonia uniflora]